MKSGKCIHQETGIASQPSDEALGDIRQTLPALLTGLWGPAAEIRRRLRNRQLTRSELRASAERIVALQRHELQQRIIDLVLDELESERLCPEVQLSVRPRPLPDLPVHALIFSAFPHVANEVYPLLVDGYIANLTHGGQAFQVVGVHEHWVIDGSIRRAMFFNEEDQGIVEADILDAPAMRTAQVLALNLREEHAAHQRIEAALPGVHFTNPYAGAAKLDDKRWTGACWQQAGLPTPRFIVLRPEMPEAARRQSWEQFTDDFESLVCKPLDGTEGQGVAMLRRGDEMPALPDGPLLVMEERGTMRYAADAGPMRCAIRLNVSWDGNHAHAESGYAQVATAESGIASAGSGGRIIPLQNLWSHLCSMAGAAISPATEDWQRITGMAQAGVAALAAALGAAMPGLVGIDILLDHAGNGAIQPVLLEANARPSGMCHAKYIAAAGPGMNRE